MVRKCTNVNPLKRPTAKEILEMLEELAPSDYFEDDFDLADDDDEEDDYDDMQLERRILSNMNKDD